MPTLVPAGPFESNIFMISIRILLADDHTLLRKGLRLLLEREAGVWRCGRGGNGKRWSMPQPPSPDVVIMDIAMPLMNGIEATKRIVEANPRKAVIVLSVHSDEAYV